MGRRARVQAGRVVGVVGAAAQRKAEVEGSRVPHLHLQRRTGVLELLEFGAGILLPVDGHRDLLHVAHQIDIAAACCVVAGIVIVVLRRLGPDRHEPRGQQHPQRRQQQAARPAQYPSCLFHRSSLSIRPAAQYARAQPVRAPCRMHTANGAAPEFKAPVKRAGTRLKCRKILTRIISIFKCFCCKYRYIFYPKLSLLFYSHEASEYPHKKCRKNKTGTDGEICQFRFYFVLLFFAAFSSVRKKSPFGRSAQGQ